MIPLLLRVAAVFWLICASLLPRAAWATPEDLSPAYGNNGVVAIAGPEVWSIVLRSLPDDRILVAVAGSAEAPRGLWCFRADGQPDSRFGSGDGFVAAAELCGAADCQVVDIAASTTGTHVLLDSGRVVRLHADGGIDRAFGLDGSALRPEGVGEVRSIGVDGHGRVLVGAQEDGHVAAALAYRLRQDGSFDASYATHAGRPGVVRLGEGHIGPAIVDRDGRLTWVHRNGGDVVQRLLPDGTRDHALAPIGLGSVHASALSVDTAGRILVGGAESLVFPRSRPVVMAFDASGAPDDAFGTGGVLAVPTDVPGADGSIDALAVDRQNRIVVAGSVQRRVVPSFGYDYPRALVARLLPNGAPDAHFAPAGVTSLRMAVGTDARGLAIAGSGRIVIAAGVIEGFRAAGKHGISRYGASLIALAGGSTDYARPLAESVAIEYLHVDHGHYFISSDVDETRRLDTVPERPSPWLRTGRTFNVWSLPEGDRLPVCRFWSGQSFAPKSSHFYTPFVDECNGLQRGRVWFYEGSVFAFKLQDTGTRACPVDTRPLYRAYNNGLSGAPNHRYTTDPSLLDEMIAQGWTMEGDATTRIFACVPRHD